MATWKREQGATQRLMANNFNEARWKTAALKNAYALMGKRRFGKYFFNQVDPSCLTGFRICCGILPIGRPFERRR
jgi:hypothetical protein